MSRCRDALAPAAEDAERLADPGAQGARRPRCSDLSDVDPGRVQALRGARPGREALARRVRGGRPEAHRGRAVPLAGGPSSRELQRQKLWPPCSLFASPR